MQGSCVGTVNVSTRRRRRTGCATLLSKRPVGDLQFGLILSPEIISALRGFCTGGSIPPKLPSGYDNSVKSAGLSISLSPKESNFSSTSIFFIACEPAIFPFQNVVSFNLVRLGPRPARGRPLPAIRTFRTQHAVPLTPKQPSPAPESTSPKLTSAPLHLATPCQAKLYPT